MKCKQPGLGFELRLPNPFPMMIIMCITNLYKKNLNNKKKCAV